MNAVRRMVGELSGDAAKRLGRALKLRHDMELRGALAAAFDGDLVRFLNALRRAELDHLADAMGLERERSVGACRAHLWMWGAELEAGGTEYLGTGLQPLPVVLGGRLVLLGDVRGEAPPSEAFPRQVPAHRPERAYEGEPDDLEDLLFRAEGLMGVRLGASGADKGAYGSRIAELLGVGEDGFSEPDWRGEVEIKTVPVVRDAAGWWKVKEDPAISMLGAAPLSKLKRVLWIARVADGSDSTVLSWYFQEWDDHVEALVSRYMHVRPKGPKGTTNKGWYLHKSFFADSGFLKTLNG